MAGPRSVELVRTLREVASRSQGQAPEVVVLAPYAAGRE